MYPAERQGRGVANKRCTGSARRRLLEQKPRGIKALSKGPWHKLHALRNPAALAPDQPGVNVWGGALVVLRCSRVSPLAAASLLPRARAWRARCRSRCHEVAAARG